MPIIHFTGLSPKCVITDSVLTLGRGLSFRIAEPGTPSVPWLFRKGDGAITQDAGREGTGSAGCHPGEPFTFCSLNFSLKDVLTSDSVVATACEVPGSYR